MENSQCIVCGSTKEVTIHHMRDIHSKKNKKKPKLSGVIYLCRDCHDVVEDIVNKGKSKRIWYHKGYQQALIDVKGDFWMTEKCCMCGKPAEYFAEAGSPLYKEYLCNRCAQIDIEIRRQKKKWKK